MLPKIDMPVFEIKLISLDSPIQYRQFTVKEEKIFLVAEQSNDDKQILSAILQVLQNCTLSEIDIRILPLFDIEYFFLQLRAKSVNNIANVKYRDTEDGLLYEFDIDLESIKPTIDPEHSKTITADKVTLTFNYPTIRTLQSMESLDTDSFDTVLDLLASCVSMISVDDKVYDPSNYTKPQLIEFLSGLTSSVFEEITSKFLERMPKLTYTIKYKNRKGTDREINLVGIKSFF
jgi:hypothetical protein